MLFPSLLPQLDPAIDRQPLCLPPDCSVPEAIAWMSRAEGGACSISCDVAGLPEAAAIELEQKSAVLVVEDERLVGIFTERDLVRLATFGSSFSGLTLQQVMSAPVIVLRRSHHTTLLDALALLRQHRIRHLPVLDEGDRLLGVVTSETVRQGLQPLNLLKWRRVAEVMTTAVVCAPPTASVLALAQQMVRCRVSCVVIAAAGTGAAGADAVSHQAIGIVTERDIVQFQTLGLNLAELQAAAVMSAPLFSVNSGDLLLEAHQQMQRQQVRRLVVTGDRGELLGIVTQTSLLKILDSTELYGIVHRLQASVDERTVELQQALQKQHDLNELKSRFVAMASHDLRNPLGTILGAVDLLECYGSNLEPQERQLDRIRAAAHHMNQLLNDLVVIGQMEAGKLTCDPAPIDPVWFCMTLIEELKLATGAAHEIRFTSSGSPVPACLDEKLLRQILTNLLSNAMKYSPVDRPIELSLLYLPAQVAFQVQDSGIGIPARDQQQIFESFYRASNVGTVSGTGLGLAIVKRCVDLHGGSIELTSTPEQGTTVVVTLPDGSRGDRLPHEFAAANLQR